MKIDTFIGSEFETPKGGVVRVISRSDKKGSGGVALYECECSICSEDTELFDAPFSCAKSVLVGGGVPCACTHYRWSQKQYEIKVKRKIEGMYTFHGFDGKFSGKTTKCVVTCDSDGHQWNPTIHNILNGQGCPKCSGVVKWDKDSAKREIEAIGFTVLSFREWKGAKTDVDCLCEEGHAWSATIDHLVNTGSGCPSCAIYGFDPNRPASFYMYLWSCGTTGRRTIKYGITNNKVDDRIKQQSKHTRLTPSKVCVIDFECGLDAMNLEKKFHAYRDSVGGPNSSKEEMGDGYTETIHEKYTEELIEMIERYS